LDAAITTADSFTASKGTLESASMPRSPDKSDGTPMKTPKEECEELMGSVVPFAEQMLSQHREFYPFGRALAPDWQNHRCRR